MTPGLAGAGATAPGGRLSPQIGWVPDQPPFMPRYLPETATLRSLCRPLSVVLLLSAMPAAPALANPESCANLWTARNEIYKAQGYCFRTQRAIAAFGNAGCQYDAIEDVPLSANDRRVIADIVRQERALRCPR